MWWLLLQVLGTGAGEPLREFVVTLNSSQTYRNWFPHTDHCAWDGIFCDPQRQVVGIYLKDFPGTGVLDDAWADLPELQKISLDVAPLLTVQLPLTLPPKLTYFELRSCLVAGALQPSYLTANLTHLIMENAILGGTLPSLSSTNTHLHTLKLDNNAMRGTLPRRLGLGALRKLWLDHNFFTGNVDFTQLLPVTDLRLNSNFLTGFLTDRMLVGKTTLHLQQNCFYGNLSLTNASVACSLDQTCVQSNSTSCAHSVRSVCGSLCLTCGDGHVQPGQEDCDYLYDRYCQQNCRCSPNTTAVSGRCVQETKELGGLRESVILSHDAGEISMLAVLSFAVLICFVVGFGSQFMTRKPYEQLVDEELPEVDPQSKGEWVSTPQYEEEEDDAWYNYSEQEDKSEEEEEEELGTDSWFQDWEKDCGQSDQGDQDEKTEASIVVEYIEEVEPRFDQGRLVVSDDDLLNSVLYRRQAELDKSSLQDIKSSEGGYVSE